MKIESDRSPKAMEPSAFRMFKPHCDKLSVPEKVRTTPNCNTLPQQKTNLIYYLDIGLQNIKILQNKIDCNMSYCINCNLTLLTLIPEPKILKNKREFKQQIPPNQICN